MRKIFLVCIILLFFETAYSSDNGTIFFTGGSTVSYNLNSVMYSLVSTYDYNKELGNKSGNEDEHTGCVPQIYCNESWITVSNRYSYDGLPPVYYQMWVRAHTAVRYGTADTVCGAYPRIADSISMEVHVYGKKSGRNAAIYRAGKTDNVVSDQNFSSGTQTYANYPTPCGIRSRHSVDIDGITYLLVARDGCQGTDMSAVEWSFD